MWGATSSGFGLALGGGGSGSGSSTMAVVFCGSAMSMRVIEVLAEGDRL